MIEVVQVSTPGQIQAVRELLREYLAWAFTIEDKSDVAPTFHGLDDELATLPGVYAPPTGALLAAMVDGDLAGCVALKRVDDETSELKRLYVRPAFRGKDLGSLLVAGLVAAARLAGYRRIILDSHRSMTSAHRIYESAGFEFVDAPPDFPPELKPLVVFMRMDVSS